MKDYETERMDAIVDDIIDEIRMGEAIWHDGMIIRDPKEIERIKKERKNKILAKSNNS